MEMGEFHSRDEFDGLDFIFNITFWCLDCHRIPFFFSDEGLSDGAFIGDIPFGKVCFVIADNSVGDRFIRVGVDQLYGGPEEDSVAFDFGNIHHIGRGNEVLKLGNLPFYQGLFLFGGVIFCIFFQVTVFPGLGDFGLDVFALFFNQMIQLFFNFGQASCGNGLLLLALLSSLLKPLLKEPPLT